MEGKHTKFRISLLPAVMALLSACGGGGSDEEVVVEPAVTVEITAIDGYIKDADVWLEWDSDGVADADEPKATTNAQGKAELVVAADAGVYQAWVRVRAGVASDTGDGSAAPVLFKREVVLTAPAGQTLVSPFTTLIALEMQRQPELTLAQASALVASSLALPAESAAALAGDFIATKDKRLQLYANKIMAAMPLVAPTTEAQRQAITADAGQIGKALTTLLADPQVLAGISDFDHIKLVEQQDGSLQANSDRDDDGVADKDDAFPEDDKRAEALETSSGTYEVKRDLGYGQGEQVLKVTYTATITRFLDGSSEIRRDEIAYYWDEEAADYFYRDGKKLEHERSEDTTWIPVRLTSNRESTTVSRWQRDFNRDNKLELQGQSYIENLGFDFGESRLEYIDSANPAIEGIDDGVDRSAYHFDDGDIKAAVTAGEFSDIERVEHFIGATNTETTKRWAVYEGDALVDFDLYKSEPSRFLEQHFSIEHINVLLESREYFTDVDGSQVEKTKKPVLVSLTDADFDEYADYTFLGQRDLNSASNYGDYWLETETRTSIVAGKSVVVGSGKRYLLDAETGGKLLTEEALEGVLFQQYESRHTQVSANETTLWSSWQHLHVPGYSFTAAVDDEGQDYKIYRKEANDLWVGHRFAEWGSREVADLAVKVEALRSDGVALDDISAVNLPGLDNYNGLLLSSSFQYDAAGKARTWYWLTRLDVSGGANEWNSDYQKLAITLTDNGLPKGSANSVIREASGVLFVHIENDSATRGYRTYPFGVWPADDNEDGIDAGNGHWSVWGGHFFLDEAAADAKLAELNGNAPE